MAQLTLYKSVYVITNYSDYQLITPVFISASTYDESGTVLIEKINPGVYKTGIYFAKINANLYSQQNVNKIIWYIQYTSNSPIVSITDYFQATLNANFSNQILMDIVPTPTPVFVQVTQNPIQVMTVIEQ